MSRPQLIELNPDNGPESGGTLLNITGTDLGIDQADVKRIMIVDTACSQVLWHSSAELSCITDALLGGGKGGIIVETFSGGPSNDTRLTYTYNYQPLISAIEPAYGPINGNTIVNITGRYFGESQDELLRVELADIPCEQFVWQNAKNIICKSAPSIDNQARSGRVKIHTIGGGVGMSADNSTFYSYSPPPVVTRSIDDNGPAIQENHIKVLGTGLGLNKNDVESITVAEQICHDINFINSTFLECRLDPLPNAREMEEPQTGPIIVTTTSGGRGDAFDSAVNANFTFNPPPRIASITPPQLSGAESNVLTIDGSHLGKNVFDVRYVLVAGQPCKKLIWTDDPSRILCRTEIVSTRQHGPIEIRTISGGKIVSDIQFTFLPNCQSFLGADRCTSNGCNWCSATTSCLEDLNGCPAHCLLKSNFDSCKKSESCVWCPATTTCLEHIEDCPPSCFMFPTEVTCNLPQAQNDNCQWCQTTQTCLATTYVSGGMRGTVEYQCPTNCSIGSPMFSCGALILTMLLLLMAVIVALGWWSVVYFVKRDDRLADRLRRYAFRLPPSNLGRYSANYSHLNNNGSNSNRTSRRRRQNGSRNSRVNPLSGEVQALTQQRAVNEMANMNADVESSEDESFMTDGNLSPSLSNVRNQRAAAINRSVGADSKNSRDKSGRRPSDAKYGVQMFQALLNSGNKEAPSE